MMYYYSDDDSVECITNLPFSFDLMLLSFMVLVSYTVFVTASIFNLPLIAFNHIHSNSCSATEIPRPDFNTELFPLEQPELVEVVRIDGELSHIFNRITCMIQIQHREDKTSTYDHGGKFCFLFFL